MIPSKSHSRVRFFLATLLLSAAICISGPLSTARAGGGPENVLVVVNSSSWASMTVANHYIQWRNIPANNVLYLPWPNAGLAISVDDFRQYLLRAVVGVIQVRNLADQIDYVVYSSDFPTTIEVTSLLGGQEPPEKFIPMASLTGTTYFWSLVQASNPGCLTLSANKYMRYDEITDPLVDSSRGFRSWYGWGERGQLLEGGGQHYMLSAMLAVTSGRGNSVREALRYLQRAVAADGTRPRGTIYYARTDDERTQRRDRISSFDDATNELRRLGVTAEVITDLLPRAKRNVAGLTAGTPRVNWSQARSTLLPGAICDNFNSIGGALDTGMDFDLETPLSVFLRYGAAGATGTVVESHGFPQKYPTAKLHVHYARGCSLAESVYQSVAGPYQLLLVGDPLCRPWATIPRIEVTGVAAGATVQGKVTIQPTAGGAAVDRFQLFVEGDLVDTAIAGETFELDTTRVTDGHAELRVVGIENSPIETQGSAVVPIVVNNHGRSIEFSATPPEAVRWGGKFTLSAESPGATVIAFYHGNLQPTNLLGSITGESGEVEVDVAAVRFGYGPLKLLAVAYASEDKSQKHAVAAPITLNVQPGSLLPGRSLRGDSQLAAGLVLTDALGRRQVITDSREPNWLQAAGVAARQQYALTAVFHAPADDIYQFQANYVGDAKIAIDGRALHDGSQDRPLQNFVPVVLAAGWHRLVLEGRAGSQPLLDLRYGSSRVEPVNGTVFFHPQ